MLAACAPRLTAAALANPAADIPTNLRRDSLMFVPLFIYDVPALP
jgi:hypothetical protein